MKKLKATFWSLFSYDRLEQMISIANEAISPYLPKKKKKEKELD